MKEFKCFECGQLFESTGSIQKHFLFVHGFKDGLCTYKCILDRPGQRCKKEFTTLKGLFIHTTLCKLQNKTAGKHIFFYLNNKLLLVDIIGS